jgi:TolB-like protein
LERLILQQQTSKRVTAVLALWVLLATGLAQAEASVRLAILPIVVHSADDPTYLRNGLADMLASRVEQSGRFEVIRVADLAAATTLLSRAIETGRSVGADFVLFGSFTRFGTGASLDMQCVSTRADFAGDSLREIFVHTGSIGEVIPDLDELVGKVGRFAIDGFDAGVDVVSAPPTAGGGSAAAERTAALEARIQKLEKAVAELVAGSETTEP